MKGLTPRQKDLLSYIEESVRKNGYSPSYREMMTHFGMRSVGSIYKHIQVLKRKGALTMEQHCSRSLIPTNPSNLSSGIKIPFIGYIAAGLPIETFTHYKTLLVPDSLVTLQEKTYVLQARGDSLNEELIADGDFLIVEARQDAQEGNLIVALINQHDTIVKRYFPEPPYVRLAGNNPHFKPTIIHEDNILVQGVVTGVLRLYNALR